MDLHSYGQRDPRIAAIKVMALYSYGQRDPRTAAAGGALGMLWPPAAGRAPAQDVTGDPRTVVSRTKHVFLWL